MKKSKLKYILTGFFAVIILLGSYWGFNYLKGTNFFRNTNTYYVVYERVDGLMASSPVTVNGFKVGMVDRIKLKPGYTGEILVSINVNQNIKIPENSIARIYSMDLMGSKGIEIVFNETDNFHKANDYLIADIEKSLKDEVNYQMLPLKNQAEDLMSEIQAALEIIQYIFNEETRDNLERSFESIKTTFFHLESSAVSLDTIMTAQIQRIDIIMDNVASISTNLRRNNKQISDILQNAAVISDSLAMIEIVTTVNNANTALNEFNITMDKINRGEGTIGQLINDDQLYHNLDNAANSLDLLLTDFRLNPKKYVNFSLINIGRTINVTDESELSTRNLRKLERQREKQKEEEEKLKESKKENNDQSYIYENQNNNIYFMIQIKSGPNKLVKNSYRFKNHTDIIELEENGIYRYFTALHYDSEDTDFLLSLIREDFPGAFAVAFIDNDLITYTEGKNKYLNKNSE